MTRSTWICLVSLSIAACGARDAAPAAQGEAPAEQPAAQPADAPAWTDITPADLAGMDPRPFVLDVRTPGEFAGGRVPGAVNIPLQDLAARAGELEAQRGGPMAVICAVGGRSQAASEQLAGLGFAQVMNVDGGTRGWAAAGYEMER